MHRSVLLVVIAISGPAVVRAQELAEQQEASDEGAVSPAPTSATQSGAPAESVPASVTDEPGVPESAAAAATEDKDETHALGLAVDLGISTAYLFRGYNMFQRDSQWNQHAFAAPSITWTVGQTGLAVGYWGAFQFAGSNIREAIDAGFGAEQDLLVTYSRPLAGDLVAGAGFTAYLYPAASEAVAGTTVPTYLEPAVFASLPTLVDLGLKVTYYHGVQDAVSAYRYVYFNPTVGKTLAFHERVSLALSGSFGFKAFRDTTTSIAKNNRFDVLAGAALPITVAGTFYVRPGVSWAWTDFQARDFSDEMVVFGCLNLGATF